MQVFDYSGIESKVPQEHFRLLCHMVMLHGRQLDRGADYHEESETIGFKTASGRDVRKKVTSITSDWFNESEYTMYVIHYFHQATDRIILNGFSKTGNHWYSL